MAYNLPDYDLDPPDYDEDEFNYEDDEFIEPDEPEEDLNAEVVWDIR